MTTIRQTLPRGAARGCLVAAPALLLSLAACGGSGGHAAGSGGASSPASALGATYRGTIYVSTKTGHEIEPFVDHITDVANCAAAAKDGTGNGTFRVPSPQAPLPQADIEISGFHGPGTYTPTMLQHDRADSILLTGKSGTQLFVISTATAGRTAGKEVLFLAKNGSGQLVYSNAHLNGDAKDPEVAGLIEWSCSS
jgi:hypothetical protein